MTDRKMKRIDKIFLGHFAFENVLLKRSRVKKDREWKIKFAFLKKVYDSQRLWNRAKPVLSWAGPDPINKFWRRFLRYAGTWPIREATSDHATDVIGLIPAWSEILCWILFVGSGPDHTSFDGNIWRLLEAEVSLNWHRCRLKPKSATYCIILTFLQFWDLVSRFRLDIFFVWIASKHYLIFPSTSKSLSELEKEWKLVKQYFWLVRYNFGLLRPCKTLWKVNNSAQKNSDEVTCLPLLASFEPLISPSSELRWLCIVVIEPLRKLL